MIDNENKRRAPDEADDFDIEKELNVFYGTPVDDFLFTEEEIDQHYDEDFEEKDLLEFDVKKEEEAFQGAQDDMDDFFKEIDDFDGAGNSDDSEPDFSQNSGLDDVLQQVGMGMDDDDEPEEFYPDENDPQDEDEIEDDEEREKERERDRLDIERLINPQYSFDNDDDEDEEDDVGSPEEADEEPYVPVEEDEPPEESSETPAPASEDEDRDPAEGKDLDSLTPEEQRAHSLWVVRQLKKGKEQKSTPSKPAEEPVVLEKPQVKEETPEPEKSQDDILLKPSYAAERKASDTISEKINNVIKEEPRRVESTEPPPDKEDEEGKSRGLRSMMQRRMRRSAENERPKALKKEEDSQTRATIISNIRTENSVREMFDRKKAAIILDDITLEIDKFLKNQKDITEKALEDIKEDTVSKPSEDTPRLENSAEKERPAAIENGSETRNEIELRGETRIAAESTEPKVKEDKITDEMTAVIDIKPLREYKNGKAHVKKPQFGKAKEDENDPRIAIVFFSLVCLAASAYAGLKANSYYNHIFLSSKGKLKPDLVDCIMKGLFSEDSIILMPLNELIFFPVFLGLALILGFIGFIRFSDAAERRKSRVGHEHGNARFGTRKDFVQFKNQFMDMSLSDEAAELKAEAKRNKKK